MLQVKVVLLTFNFLYILPKVPFIHGYPWQSHPVHRTLLLIVVKLPMHYYQWHIVIIIIISRICLLLRECIDFRWNPAFGSIASRRSDIAVNDIYITSIFHRNTTN